MQEDERWIATRQVMVSQVGAELLNVVYVHAVVTLSADRGDRLTVVDPTFAEPGEDESDTFRVSSD